MRATVRTTAVATFAVITASLAPSTASAQPAARVVLYEVTESLRMSPSDHDRDDDAGLSRLARASLLSDTVVTLGPTSPFGVGCPAEPPTCYMTATASSDVPFDPGTQTFGAGSISGTFDVAVLMGPRSLSYLFVQASGQLTGKLDLRPVFSGYAPVSGQWSIRQRHETSHRDSHGRPFAGWFLIPIDASQLQPWLPGLPDGLYYFQDLATAVPSALHLSDDTCRSGALYGDPRRLRVCQLDPRTESVLGFPLTKAVISLEN